MNIHTFKNYKYDTNDLFFDKPCEVKGVTLYPIKTKDYENFLGYAQYLMFSKKHLGLDKVKDVDLLNGLIFLMANARGNSEEDIGTVLIEMSNLFRLLTHKEIKSITTDKGFEFVDEEETLRINKDNFNTIRKVALKMSLLTEPKIYDSELDRKWAEKARIAHQNGKPLELGEIVLVVSQDMKFTVEQTLNLNIFQLHSYYMRIMQIYECETTRLFATVSPDCKPTPFAKSIFDELYRDHDDDYNIKSSDFEKMLK